MEKVFRRSKGKMKKLHFFPALAPFCSFFPSVCGEVFQRDSNVRAVKTRVFRPGFFFRARGNIVRFSGSFLCDFLIFVNFFEGEGKSNKIITFLISR